MNPGVGDTPSLTRFAWLSVAGAIVTIILKTVAWFLTGSVGLLSDALESLVNLVGGILALSMLTIAAHPDDEDHPFGHGKAEYFSSGAEGALIIVAAISIVMTALPKLVNPVPLEQIGVGLGVSLLASLINFLIARILLRAARESNSITLEANANHLMTDVWTSVGVVVGIGGVIVTGWNRLDPIIAILVGLNIIVSGVGIMKKSIAGLMDSIWPQDELDQFNRLLEPFQEEGIRWHGLRTRQAGSGRFATIHILVPDEWTVLQGHQMLERIEGEIRKAMPRVMLTTHLEPLNDPGSQRGIPLARSEEGTLPSAGSQEKLAERSSKQ